MYGCTGYDACVVGLTLAARLAIKKLN